MVEGKVCSPNIAAEMWLSVGSENENLFRGHRLAANVHRAAAAATLFSGKIVKF